MRDVRAALRQQRIETPSWAYGNSGTRFKVFAQPGVPRNPEEKIADAAVVHRLTGVAPTVALHIPWDKVDDYAALAKYADDQGVGIGAINSNVFQDDDYKLGSVTNPDPTVRRKAIDHLLECVDIMDATGSRDLKLWFSDGTNYPGQDSIRARQDRLAEALREVYDRLGDRPADAAGVQALRAGLLHHRRAGLGHLLRPLHRAGPQGHGVHRHRPPRAGHQHRVHRGVPAAGREARRVRLQLALLRRRRPDGRARPTRSSCSGSCTRSSRPTRWAPEAGIAFMLDQCHNIEAKIPAIIRSVMNVQEATAKALLVDTAALAAAQQAGDVLDANAVLMDAYNTDVRPLLRELREEMGLDPDPIAAYKRSGYQERIVADRVGGQQAGWGA